MLRQLQLELSDQRAELRKIKDDIRTLALKFIGMLDRFDEFELVLCYKSRRRCDGSSDDDD